MASWPRGSEWRKWDLHLHAPGTRLNDAFTTEAERDIWDEFCRRLHESDVQVFGVTDYFCATCFFETRKQFLARYPDSPKLLIPNIELRYSYVLNKAQEEVNVHVLFNPFRDDLDVKLRDFLGALQTNRTDNAGRRVKAADLLTIDDFAGATTSKEFIQHALDDTFGTQTDRLDHVLVVTAANNDGIRPERGKKRKETLTDELDKFSDAFFGHSGNVVYYLDTARGEDETVIAKPKPVITGCDAHSLRDLDEKLGHEIKDGQKGSVLGPTWIKADPNWEGLKQIVFEPENRVFIGAEPAVARRVRENKTRYIKSLHITNIQGYSAGLHGRWFENENISLNSELVAIIGNKGSGKSALADIIGLLGNSHNQTAKLGQKPEELFSFLNSEKFLKGGCATHFEATLRWYDGEPDRRVLDAQVALQMPQKVEYLPQKYLERICANVEDDEFRTTLNEVVFRYVRKQDQHGRDSLEELIKFLAAQAEEDIARKKRDLHEANARVVSIEQRLTQEYLKEVEGKKAEREQELHAHASIRPAERDRLGEQEATAVAEEIQELADAGEQLRREIKEREEELVDLSDTIERLRQARQAIASAVADLERLSRKHSEVLATAQLTLGQILTVAANYSLLDAAIAGREERRRVLEKMLRSDEEVPPIEAVSPDEAALGAEGVAKSLVARLALLEGRRALLVDQLGRPAREYEEYLEALRLWQERDTELRGDAASPGAETLLSLNIELEALRNELPHQLLAARNEREGIARALFRSKRDLLGLYDNVKRAIDAKIADCRDDLGAYDIAVEAGLRISSSFVEDFLSFINQAAVGSYKGVEEGRAMMRDRTSVVARWDDEEQVFVAIQAIADALHTDNRGDRERKDQKRDLRKQLKGQRTPEDLYDFLYGFDYLVPKYDLKVDGKDLSELSPGERGGLLLIFYLMLDQREIPLVIDQPEDNLDNRSIYEILVKFIKQAKTRRQILIVTHNPNLAVVADAEQIIRVSIDKKEGKHDFDFFSGAIEEPRINRAVVDILEGTLPAFDNRRLKYRKREAGM